MHLSSLSKESGPLKIAAYLSPITAFTRKSQVTTSRRNFNSYKNQHRHDTTSRRMMKVGITVCAAALAVKQEDEESDLQVGVDCCGIVGCIGVEGSYDILSNGITILQNRGYDSAGIATVDAEGRMVVTKKASIDGEGGRNDDSFVDAIEAVKSHHQKHKGAIHGIAHTRWATHGGKTDMNAHPHCDVDENIALVHNGTISNYRLLKAWLEDEGVFSKSDTDSEIIVNLIGHFCAEDGSNFEEAFRRTISKLRGTWGIICIHKKRPDIMVVARHGSPLLIGHIGTGFVVASEQSALSGLLDCYVEIDENETIILGRDGGQSAIASKVTHKINCDSIFLSPAPYEYWTDREIQEQPISIQSALSGGSRTPRVDSVRLGGLDVAAEKLMIIERLTLLGCGTSYHAALFGACLMRKLTLFSRCRAEDASEFNTSEMIPTALNQMESEGACLLSQSGETLDLMLVCGELRDAGVTLFSIINVVGSALARKTNLGVYINAGREVAVASTKAFMCQAVILCLVSCWFHEKKAATSSRSDVRKEIISSLTSLHSSVATVLASCQKPVERLVNSILNNRSMFILGKGLGYPVALEGALKVKEISYLHAEGFGGGSLKHGPFAMLSPEEHTPVILLIFDDEYRTFMMNAAEQVKARNSRVVIITDLPVELVSHLSDHVWSVPSIGTITPLLAVVPMQVLAFELSKMRGFNPDKPRGLAKTVTVW
eukprot:GHVH01008813.1.p1 GENE.GHVH01008813.1~~GHVH01008813.1.p1  ORF type:complete len:715 (+),score=96.83 GHVH01008813.1:1804-3948(+)